MSRHDWLTLMCRFFFLEVAVLLAMGRILAFAAMVVTCAFGSAIAAIPGGAVYMLGRATGALPAKGMFKKHSRKAGVFEEDIAFANLLVGLGYFLH